jgi:hypothetical protein
VNSTWFSAAARKTARRCGEQRREYGIQTNTPMTPALPCRFPEDRQAITNCQPNKRRREQDTRHPDRLAREQGMTSPTAKTAQYIARWASAR